MRTGNTDFITPATPSERLIERLDREPFALSFSGQGYAWLPGLRETLAGGVGAQMARHLEDAQQILEPVAADIAAQFPHGFEPLRWAEAAEDPSFELTDAAISTPGILTAQVALLESLRAQGLDPAAAVASLGHSQGALATYVAQGEAGAGEVIALAQLIGAAITRTARIHGLVRTAAGAPMAAVSGATRQQLEEAGATIGLCNGRDSFVIVGTPEDNAAVRRGLERLAAADAKAIEAKLRGGKAFAPRFSDLDVQAAYHHPAMAEAVALVEDWAQRAGLGAELSARGARAVLTDVVDWPEAVTTAVDEGARWILECGPTAGVEPLTRKIVAGRGVGTLVVSTAQGQAALFDAGRSPQLPADWSQLRPRLHNGRVYSKFTDLTGYSPVMLPGMTPSTVDPEIVAAAANAGFWAELAGGGQTTSAMLDENLARLEELLEPGVNAQFNAMYLSASQWRRQVEGQRAIPKARANGAHISGIIVSAGIPPFDEAVALLEQLRAENFPWIAFKPGTVKQIDQVLRIAVAVDFDIIMQIEGGHAGGHHSWEDLDELLIEAYAKIRSQDNVVLAVGGGIGTPDVGAAYLTGTWAQKYGLAPMPVDAIMIGTAAMATLESTASESVKQALVDAQPVTENHGWAGAGSARGGIASGRSQLGADIHEIDNSFARAGRLLDEVAGDAEAVAARREEIIAAIAKTAKPYFGDVAEMTYEQWLGRYLELSYRGHWVDVSWAQRFERMVERAEARLSPQDHGEFAARIAVDGERPYKAVRALVAEYGDAPLHVGDVTWFLKLLEEKGKPANFVPVINSEVRRWWRQDSLWQAHDERYAADEVCIIPGTTAVAGITRANEPVAHLLARFEAATAERLEAETPDAAAAARAELIEMCEAASIDWAGRAQVNPVRLVMPRIEVSGTGKDLRAQCPETGASLERDAEGGYVLRAPLRGAIAGASLRIRLEAPQIPGASPTVSAQDARQAMRELAQIAAGGQLPQVVDGTAQWNAQLSVADCADYENVTAGYGKLSGLAPDVLVGKAWPAVFAVIAHGQTEQGADVVEGLLNLVHLEHSAQLHADLPREAQLEISARGTSVLDTTVGRVVEVKVEISTAGTLLATLRERFAIQGRRGTQELAPAPAKESVTDKPRSFRTEVNVVAPESMQPFAAVTGDRNPIHVSAAAAALAGLPHGVIVHGMWTSALAQLAAGFDGASVAEWEATMLAPVLPGAQVDFVVERSGVDNRAGLGEVRTVTASVGDVPVLQAQAIMRDKITAYGFPGQGIQSQGMGMDSFASSPAARSVWERADSHTRSRLGFSILEVVRANPASVTVAGEEFSHPDGALFLTQFTQMAMATLGCAQIAEMQEAGVLDSGAYFAGHSVGEYNALAAYAQVLSLEAVLEIVYARGLTMHRLVERDEHGNSNYGLAALRPNKIGISAEEVFDYVSEIAGRSGEFLEIVNYNIAGVQYAVAGTRAGLAALREDAESRAPGKRAFIQIPGIDVPFHSSRLLDGVPAFREHLDSLIPTEIDLEILLGHYIPNLVARPFGLDSEFVESIDQVVDSAAIKEILADFPAAAQDSNKLGRTLLIELLAWQFASPVRWIETQDLFLCSPDETAGAGTPGLGVERFIEIGVGSAPTLANMLGQTLRLPQYAGHPIEVLNVERDRPTVFAEDAVERPEPAASATEAAEVTEATSAGATSADAAATPAAPATPAPAPALAAAPAAPAGGETPADKALSVADAVEMLVAIWTKVRPDQIGPTDTIELLVEGVSSRRNQLLLDLGVEFGLGAIDGAADAPLGDLQQTVTGMAKGYRAFGPVLADQVADSLRRLTGPAGKKPSYIAERVTGTWGLGEGWVDRVTAELVLGTREGASLRGGELATLGTAAPHVKELDALIDAAVQAAGARAQVSIAMPSTGAGAGGVVDSAALDEFSAQLTDSLAETARTLLKRLGIKAPTTEFSTEPDGLADLVSRELGSDWPRQVAPAFDANKAVLLDDRWASAREDLTRLKLGELSELDVFGAGEEVAQMAEYLGLDEQASDARQDPAQLPYSSDVAVVTGGSPHSIAAAVIAQLLSEGATVVATTSRLDHARLEFYKELYRSHACGNAALWVVPANLSSFSDVDALIEWVGNEQTATVGGKSKLLKPALVPTLLFPFAAPRVQGTLADAGAQAEAQMRLLLWSVEKLIAGLSQIGADTHVGQRLHVVLPGSPNRGRFGGDGAYGESKAALDALVTRWHAEPVWGERTSLVHAHIGWVRGTGLMGGNDPMVELVEAKGVSTYSPAEIAVQLVDSGAQHSVRKSAAQAPITLDFTGGLGEADINLPELAREAAARSGETAPASEAPRSVRALPSIRRHIEWTSPDFSGVTQNLDDMVVIVGAGELGPVGSSRTRYEVELSGDLSAAGVIELAWSTGLIAWDGGWTVTETGEEISEEDIYERFHDEVIAGVGVRRYHDDFGPKRPMVDNLAPELTTIYLERDMTFAVSDEAAAKSFVEDVEGASAYFDGEEWQVTRPAGSAVRVPRRVAMSRFVGGQIPKGFDPAVYGIPADMIDNLDRVALWNLVCTVDAFLAAGFSPAELLSEVHPSRVSSTQGTGMGGMQSLRSLYVDKLLAEPRPNDILQESLPNVVAAHVMQSYVGGYGQMIHPIAACATAAVSVEEGFDKLRLRKADFVVAGGIDDLSIEGITGFGDMAATADSQELEDKGIDHKFFSRANDRRRAGFIESEGGGTILLARGSLALKLGLPVLGVVAFAESFGDGAHTSIPAPGLGALSSARGGKDSRLALALREVGVSADEVSIVSKHDTSTNANDPNESDLHERIAGAIGRSAGNPFYVISQKSLTGHTKGGAAMFQMMGLTQVLREGIIPPNRALDCVDPVLRKHSHLTWLRRPLNLRSAAPKAGLVTSLGFGHVSALVAIVHPGAFLQAVRAAHGEEAAQAWEASAQQREDAGLRRLDDAMHGGAALYQRPVDRNLGGTGDAVKEREAAILLDGTARLKDGVLTPGAEL
ncbi:type I polyketide synthase [Corynebacterium flavescens]|uniref:type I polyketide synthase n=2 Tax=Corynebacterium flavescens TaxID=28028 RepID=UPI0023F47F70